MIYRPTPIALLFNRVSAGFVVEITADAVTMDAPLLNGRPIVVRTADAMQPGWSADLQRSFDMQATLWTREG